MPPHLLTWAGYHGHFSMLGFGELPGSQLQLQLRRPPPATELSRSRDAMTKAHPARPSPIRHGALAALAFRSNDCVSQPDSSSIIKSIIPLFVPSALRSTRPLRSSPHPLIANAMFLQRTAVAAARRAAVTPVMRRSFTASMLRRRLSPRRPSHRKTRTPPRAQERALSADFGLPPAPNSGRQECRAPCLHRPEDEVFRRYDPFPRAAAIAATSAPGPEPPPRRRPLTEEIPHTLGETTLLTPRLPCCRNQIRGRPGRSRCQGRYRPYRPRAVDRSGASGDPG